VTAFPPESAITLGGTHKFRRKTAPLKRRSDNKFLAASTLPLSGYGLYASDLPGPLAEI
jgi:hypothetical protein